MVLISLTSWESHPDTWPLITSGSWIMNFCGSTVCSNQDALDHYYQHRIDTRLPIEITVSPCSRTHGDALDYHTQQLFISYLPYQI